MTSSNGWNTTPVSTPLSAEAETAKLFLPLLGDKVKTGGEEEQEDEEEERPLMGLKAASPCLVDTGKAETALRNIVACISKREQREIMAQKLRIYGKNGDEDEEWCGGREMQRI